MSGMLSCGVWDGCHSWGVSGRLLWDWYSQIYQIWDIVFGGLGWVSQQGCEWEAVKIYLWNWYKHISQVSGILSWGV